MVHLADLRSATKKPHMPAFHRQIPPRGEEIAVSQVMMKAGPRNHLYLLGPQVMIKSCPRNHSEKPASLTT